MSVLGFSPLKFIKLVMNQATILHPSTAKNYFTCPDNDLIDSAVRLAWAVIPKKCVDMPPNRYMTKILHDGGRRTFVVLNHFRRGELCRFRVTEDKLVLEEKTDNSTAGGSAPVPEIHRQAKVEAAKFRGAHH
jgi:hypothetical protein